MRVLMLAWDFPPASVGGNAAHVNGLIHALGASGHDVVLFTLAHPGVLDDVRDDGVRVLRARVAMVASARGNPISGKGRQIPVEWACECPCAERSGTGKPVCVRVGTGSMDAVPGDERRRRDPTRGKRERVPVQGRDEE